LAGNPRRESKVVLDSRARACLPSGRTGLDDQRVDALGCRVDSGRKTRWSGADDDDIAHVSFVDSLVEVQIVGNLVITGIPQHRLAAADQDRYVGRVYVKAIEQARHVGVTVKLEVLEGVTVAREECLDAQSGRGLAGAPDRTNEQHVANALRYQLAP